MPEVTETETSNSTKGGVIVASAIKKTTTTTVICTPVYGMANSCTEHVVVDTGAADSIFFNFAGLAYVAGLTSFIKAKTLKK
jgi:co-chaperonin GroES (HSP10)